MIKFIEKSLIGILIFFSSRNEIKRLQINFFFRYLIKNDQMNNQDYFEGFNFEDFLQQPEPNFQQQVNNQIDDQLGDHNQINVQHQNEDHTIQINLIQVAQAVQTRQGKSSFQKKIDRTSFKFYKNNSFKKTIGNRKNLDRTINNFIRRIIKKPLFVNLPRVKQFGSELELIGYSESFTDLIAEDNQSYLDICNRALEINIQVQNTKLYAYFKRLKAYRNQQAFQDFLQRYHQLREQLRNKQRLIERNQRRN